MIKIAPSVLSADFADMRGAIEHLNAWEADWVHLDVMDGHFVPNLTFGPMMCKAVRPLTTLPLDVHLMVSRPADWIEPFHQAGADSITFHVETEAHIQRQLQHIRSLGMRAGVVLNPATPLVACEEILTDCDLILLMSVNPGFGGQSFLPGTVDKIRRLRRMLDSINPACDIEVDGGVNPTTARLCIEAGATALVAGNSVFTAKDPAAMIRMLRG